MESTGKDIIPGKNQGRNQSGVGGTGVKGFVCRGDLDYDREEAGGGTSRLRIGPSSRGLPRHMGHPRSHPSQGRNKCKNGCYRHGAL